MKKIFSTIFSIFLLNCLFTLSSCDPEESNDGELITTVIYTLIDSANNVSTFSFRDLDGDGGNIPVITTTDLKQNTNYSCEIAFLNESVSPIEDITEEVNDEAEAHQIFYLLSGMQLNMKIRYDDLDTDNNPIGIKTKCTTGNAGFGTLNIVLKHEPNKNDPAVRNGDINLAGGDTDVSVEFKFNVE